MDRVEEAIHPDTAETYTCKLIASAINLIHSFSAERPKPLPGAVVRGDLWPQNDHIMFDGLRALQGYLNSRIVLHKERFNRMMTTMVLCHNDLASPNTLVRDETIHLLD